MCSSGAGRNRPPATPHCRFHLAADAKKTAPVGRDLFLGRHGFDPLKTAGLEKARTGHGMGEADSPLRKREKRRIVSHSVCRIGPGGRSEAPLCTTAWLPEQRWLTFPDSRVSAGRGCTRLCGIVHPAQAGKAGGRASRPARGWMRAVRPASSGGGPGFAFSSGRIPGREVRRQAARPMPAPAPSTAAA